MPTLFLGVLYPTDWKKNVHLFKCFVVQYQFETFIKQRTVEAVEPAVSSLKLAIH